MNKTEDRTKVTAEVFTPKALVLEMLQKLPIEAFEPEKTILDNSCGNGQFLANVFLAKVEYAVKHEIHFDRYDAIVPSIFGVDLMADNVSDTVARLAILEKYGIDPIDENASWRINHPVYADDHDRAWLQDNHSSFSRRYWGTIDDTEFDVTITFEYFDDGDAGVFRYTFADGTTAINPNIVCQDALKYNYCFSKVKKQVLKFE